MFVLVFNRQYKKLVLHTKTQRRKWGWDCGLALADIGVECFVSGVLFIVVIQRQKPLHVGNGFCDWK
jgi:hypothetical protein